MTTATTAPRVATRRKSTPDAATTAGLRWLLQHDLYALAQLFARDRSPNHLSPDFHGSLCRRVQTTPYAKNLYLLPRGHFKTDLLTETLNVQRILRDPEVRIQIASSKQDIAGAMLEGIKGKLQHPVLLTCFPDILWPDPQRQSDKWTTSALTVKRRHRAREATIETTGLEGEITSKHYDARTMDDLVGQQNSQTREQVLGVIEWWKKSQGLNVPHTVQDIVGTPWHYADLYCWMQEQAAKGTMDLGVYRVPCWTQAPDGARVPALPERFSVETLEGIRADQGSAVFAAQYLLDPIDEDTAVFPLSAIRPHIVARRDVPPLDTLWTVMTVDPAISTKSWADYSAIAVGGFDGASTLWLLDLRRGRWTEAELIRQIYDAWERTPGLRTCAFEAVGFQKLYARLLTIEGERRGAYLPLLKLERDTKITKNVRIRGLQPVWERGGLKLVDDLRALQDFLEEASRFRTDRENVHDDMLDAVVDLFQVRARPSGDARRDVPDDADERDVWAYEHQQARAARGDRLLDTTELAVAWTHAKRRELWDAQVEAASLGAERDEFWR